MEALVESDSQSAASRLTWPGCGMVGSDDLTVIVGSDDLTVIVGSDDLTVVVGSDDLTVVVRKQRP